MPFLLITFISLIGSIPNFAGATEPDAAAAIEPAEAAVFGCEYLLAGLDVDFLDQDFSIFDDARTAVVVEILRPYGQHGNTGNLIFLPSKNGLIFQLINRTGPRGDVPAQSVMHLTALNPDGTVQYQKLIEGQGLPDRLPTKWWTIDDRKARQLIEYAHHHLPKGKTRAAHVMNFLRLELPERAIPGAWPEPVSPPRRFDLRRGIEQYF